MSYNLSCEQIANGMQNLGADKDLKVAANLTQSGKFPPRGTKIIAFYATPIWGITIFEADSEEAVFKAMPGLLSFFEVFPALPIENKSP
jgi:hypothetical protein